jgi:hypothetical protein
MRVWLLGIFISSLLWGRIFYVPEEIPSIRRAIKIVNVGDTISYDPGLIAEPVNWDIIQSKGVVITYRRTPNYLPAMRSFSSSMPDSGYWTGQARVTSPNSHYGSTSRITIDSTGIPWVVWIGYTYDDPTSAVWYSRWDNGAWTQQLRVSTPEDSVDLQHRIAMDGSGYPWVVWHRYVSSYRRDVYFSRWNGSAWEPEQRVNPPDSVMNGPGWIGCGGGKVWASWERGIWGQWGDILASRWNGYRWEPPVMISEPDGIEDGYPFAMVVDSEGRAHFVWTRWDTNGIFPIYRMYDGDSLGPLVWLNEPGGGISGEWPDIDIDTLGNLHFAWTGIMEYPPVNSYVFYRMYDGESWSDPIWVNRLDGLGNWRTKIDAVSPDNIWITWDGVDSTGEYHIYAVHYDGVSWSDEMRLDSDITNDDGGPDIDIDLNFNPWVVWSGYEVSTDTRQVFYNRYTSVLISEKNIDIVTKQLILPNPFVDEVYVIFKDYIKPGTEIDILNSEGRKVSKIKNVEGYTIRLNLNALPSGVYFLRIEKKNYVYVQPLVKLRRR